MHKRFWVNLLGILLIVGGVLMAGNSLGWFDYHVKCAFNGNSRNLKQTVIIPALDTPLPAEKNAIWCSSFQLAWNHARDDVIHAPIRLSGSVSPISSRLNMARQSENDLPDGACYAAAGLVKDGIISKIQDAMAQQFPGHPMPTFASSGPGNIIAYGYLEVNAPFSDPFAIRHSALRFTDSSHKTVALTSFGIDHGTIGPVRETVEVGFCADNMQEYIINLFSNNNIQITLACIPQKATLAATVADAEAKQAAISEESSIFRANDTLAIPNMSWQVTHHFAELENQPVVNPGFAGYSITDARQLIDFYLDHKGARLRSESQLTYTNALASDSPQPRHFLFNRPFLIYLRLLPVSQGKPTQPFFAMWVDNAELLDKW